ncbi:MAG TPA: hypothetical protein VJH67_01715 [Candidatus Paceibacterota bacterium]
MFRERTEEEIISTVRQMFTLLDRGGHQSVEYTDAKQSLTICGQLTPGNVRRYNALLALGQANCAFVLFLRELTQSGAVAVDRCDLSQDLMHVYSRIAPATAHTVSA